MGIAFGVLTGLYTVWILFWRLKVYKKACSCFSETISLLRLERCLLFDLQVGYIALKRGE